MKPGDLRRFKDAVRSEDRVALVAAEASTWPGCHFLVLEVDCRHSTAHGGSVKFLIDGQIEAGWSLPWIMNNSEPVDAAG